MYICVSTFFVFFFLDKRLFYTCVRACVCVRAVICKQWHDLHFHSKSVKSKATGGRYVTLGKSAASLTHKTGPSDTLSCNGT